MIEKLYRLSVGLYFALIKLASFFNPKADLFYRGRRNMFLNLRNNLPANDSPLVWFHAASLGEFEQGRPVIEALKKQRPHLRILLTFFSPSGFEVRKGYQVAGYICYLPIESPRNVKKFYDLVKPDIAVFIKYEFWKGYIDEAKKRGVHLVSISAIFRENQIFFKPFGGLFRKSLLQFNRFFVQNEESAELLGRIGIGNTTVAGDTRFDRVTEIRQQSKKIEIAEVFKNNEKLIVLGSVWPDDMAVFYPIMYELASKLKFIIAPHQIEEAFISKIEKKAGLPAVRFSQANEENLAACRVLIIDNIGMLSSLYGYGEMAYVGGGFHGGLHNTLEPAAFSVPVIWGDHAKNIKFQETEGLIQAGGGFSIRTSEELSAILKGFLADGSLLEEKGNAAGNFVRSNTGATSQIVDYLTAELDKK